jgi:hypothetical protein
LLFGLLLDHARIICTDARAVRAEIHIE